MLHCCASRCANLTSLERTTELLTSASPKSVQLVSEREKGNFLYFDAARLIVQGAKTSLDICVYLASNVTPDCLVIIDDYSALLYAGEDPKELLRSFKNLWSMARKVIAMAYPCPSEV